MSFLILLVYVVVPISAVGEFIASVGVRWVTVSALQRATTVGDFGVSFKQKQFV